jgi:anthranilate phosphoribosyltransferase
VHPSDFGLAKAAAGALVGGDAAVNAAIITRVLGGDPGPARDVVLLNAGAALMVAGVAGSVRDGIARAAEAIDAGDTRRTLARLVAASQAEKEGGA